MTISIEHGRAHRQFRATALAKGSDTLTALTAAHCLTDDDEGGTALVILDGEVMEAKVLAVVRNPSYRPTNGNDLPGPDNALLRLRVDPGNRLAEEAFRGLRTAADLADHPIPARSGQTVSVRMVDKEGQEHTFRAGNYSNYRLLEWGPTYRPVPGDSGGGVFGFRRSPDGRLRPVLIGVVVGQSGEGGAASLVSLDQTWLAEALAR